ncbi:MAG TPA: response regulator [Candidatus Saccharimonadales bacterium]
MDKQKRILIVDDDDQISQMYTTLLNIKGFKTQRVNNGEDALVVVQQFKPDLILLDVMMPKISGFDVADILHNTNDTKEIPIIMLSALGGKEDREKAAASGVVYYYVKTEIDTESIAKKIEEILSKA